MKKINIKGVIVSNDDAWIYDLFDVEHTSPNDIIEALDNAENDELEVVINSPGGNVFAGSEIYTALKDYAGKVTTKIVGIAASMGSVIAMAGDTVKVSPTAQIMIHNVSNITQGDYRDMEHSSDVLKNMNKSIASAYRNKSGLEENELLAMMDNETWLNAEQAKEKGFADEVMFESNQLVASASESPMIPQQVINKIRNMQDKFKRPVESPKGEDQSDILMAKFNLLKLKGDVNE
ncbi:ATP-dependent Clp protease proteolytic subunit [Halolactibacillus miurensis]|uniref:ATP-dependent Clp protease proteolytic subunit n=1 Tax=Halolactibacillus miurensis TaxID=306541 RepID=A0A1I6SHA8_9BACI|nr:head maturation protease, ClpP-related [Halolactibacillus miurensis]GEM04102.1 ATP-dependent Clp protease proteolytic subunit [Halolactibacillus miurensis]SFS76351.1 ATP-dependent Clp protease, protease subunit [Halolactibacillus miurensis]